MTKCKYSLVGAMVGTYIGLNLPEPVAVSGNTTINDITKLTNVLIYTAIGYSIGTALCKV